MMASTLFFFAEAQTVGSHWRTSLHVGALVTFVAAVHYMYMREYWVQTHVTPIVYRYVDWSITVPLQMIEFNLILRAAGKPVSPAGFWKLLLGTVVMLLFGYLGEISVLPAWPAFICGLCGWAFILFEVFAGESGGAVGGCSVAVCTSFNNMRMIVTLGWCIYPLGYLFGYLLGTVDDTFLNVIYNIADFVNKIAFVLACWSCAKEDSEMGAWDLLDKAASEKATGVAGSHSARARDEAAQKLMSNYKTVIADLTNQSSSAVLGGQVTQRELRRVSPAEASDVDAMLREVARRLLGCPGGGATATAESAGTWQACGTYLAGRTQAKAAACPGRAADMSEAAAAAFVAVVEEVGSGK